MSTTTNAGQGFRIWNFTLSTSFQKIVLNQKVNSILIQCRTAVDIYIDEDNSGTDYFTIKAGSALTLDLSTRTLEPFSLKAASGTPVAEIIATFE